MSNVSPLKTSTLTLLRFNAKQLFCFQNLNNIFTILFSAVESIAAYKS